jgi:ATP-dependent helicase/nuclease subunit A
MLTVYKASAGSGKTFQLVKEYLKILIRNPLSYRNILAVTFTNKATNEMKSRILEQLFLLGGGKNSAYVDPIKEELSVTENSLRENAGKALKNILHDYNRFSVSTIDSFTQRVIKAFNREMGISPNFVISLDDQLILEEATDRLLAKVDADKQMCKWLVEFSGEKIRDNRSQRIEEDIKALGEELFREKFQVFFPEKNEDHNPYTRNNLDAFRIELDKMILWYENSLRNKGKAALDVIEKEGLETGDFSGKSRGPGAFFKKLAGGEQPNISSTVHAWAESVEAWYTKKSEKRDHIHRITASLLKPLLEDILRFYSDNNLRYETAGEVRKQLRTLGVLTDLKEEVRHLLLEKEYLQLSDSNLLLSKIIDDSDSPFIYEKTGIRFNYFMLDEFQDTSSLQWKNFKPLVGNALAEGYSALLVGDVKQSIYRWRNSDWNILASQINADFPQYTISSVPLNHNWRSRPDIIEFNNQVFSTLKQTFETFLLDDIEEEKFRRSFSEIYREITQKPGTSYEDNRGRVEIRFLPEDDFERCSAELLVEQVKKLQDSGLKASDIAILIRKNKEGAPIVETFLEAARRKENEEYNLTVLSNESLFLYASKGVNLVMLVVALLVDSDNRIQKVALLHLWLSWLKPFLRNAGIIPSVKNHYDTGDMNPGTTGIWSVDENFEAVFEEELGLKMRQLRQKVLLTSLDETVTGICNLFGLFHVDSELPFLQTLIDQAAEIKTSLSNDLSNLLYWWNKKGLDVSVSVNEEVDSVRLLTVHKSKGLEFEAVLIPFFNWNASSWSGNQAPLLWCRPGIEPFSRFPLLPVKAKTKLTHTLFRDDYFEEKVNSYIDTLNLVYVAFTRAKAALFINGKKPKEKESSREPEKPAKLVNELLHYALNQMVGNQKFATCWNEDKTVFRFGELPGLNTMKSAGRPYWITHYCSGDFSNRIRLRLNSEEFLVSDEQRRSVKNTGKLIHEILAEVKTVEDMEPACERAYKQKKISREEKSEILVKLKNSLNNPVIRHWYTGDFRILNERNLLDRHALLRPDRVLILDRKAVVIDYKWGEKMPDKYRKQVFRYADTLKKCGFEEVEGYLWYINQDEVEKVL